MVSESYAGVVEAWQATAGRVLDLAAVAARAEVADIANLNVDDHESLAVSEHPGVVVDRTTLEGEIDRLIADSEQVVNGAVEDGGPGRAMSALVGTMTVSATLLAAAEPPDAAVRSFGLEDGTVSVAYEKELIRQLRRTLFGDPPPGVVLPSELSDQVKKLQTAGTKELVAVTTETVLWSSFSGVVSVVETLDTSGKLKEAVDGIKAGFHWLKRAALKLLAWTLDKFRALVPDKFKKTFDEKLGDLKSTLKNEAMDTLPNAVGALFGRIAAEDAWAKAMTKAAPNVPPTDALALKELEDAKKALQTAEEALPSCTLEHSDRIGQASSFREGAIKVAGVLMAMAALPPLAQFAPFVQGAVVLAAVAVVGFVGYQMWDGFNDIERLVPAS